MTQEFDEDLSIEKIEKYNKRVPRYTSYPTVPNWDRNDFGPRDYLDHLHQISDEKDPISLYFHIPFCERRCLFCACNTIITQRSERSERYLEYLKKEIDTVGQILGDRREVVQLHLGGGTPTHLTTNQLDELFNHLKQKFEFADDAEQSIEVHPSVTSQEQISVLVDHGFNRLSMGVQDFDPVVQKKLNRHQTYEETRDLIEYSRELGMESINVDLIYGLPYQTIEGFLSTIDQIFTLQPDRVAMYSYAHFPQIFKHHQGIPLDVIAKGSSKMERFLKARRMFLDNDYQQIGFDHFALKNDDLWTSYQDKTLRRNFMGYTTKASTDLIAFGWSGISELSTSYAQHSKTIAEYEDLVDRYGVATIKGHTMTQDDRIRKDLIMDILCQGEIDLNRLEQKYKTELPQIRQDAQSKLPELEHSGFVFPTDSGWELTGEGQIFGRIVAAAFDKYFKGQHLFSTSI